MNPTANLHETPPPFDETAEQAVLGAILIDNAAIDVISSVISVTDFYRPRHQKLFRVFQALYAHGTAIDLLTTRHYLESHNQIEEGIESYLAALCDVIPTSANIRYHANIVKDKAMRRAMYYKGLDLGKMAFQEDTPIPTLLQQAEQAISDLSQQQAVNLADLNLNFDYTPTPEQVLIEMDGQKLLSEGNLMGIVAGIGVGKSHVCELIASLWINPHCEPEGSLKVNRSDGDMCIYFDTERTKNDCHQGLFRMSRRMAAEHDASVFEDTGGNFKHFRLFPLISIDAIATRRTLLLQAIQRIPRVKLVIIDGILDLSENPNDPAKSIELGNWLLGLANKYNLGILYTIHGNRNDESGKGKGWTGDVMQRKSMTFLNLRADPNNPQVKLLTSDFGNKKVRSGKDTDLVTAFQWSNETNCYRCISYERKDNPLQGLFFSCYMDAGKRLLSHTELVNYVMEQEGCAKRTATRRIEKAIETNIIKKHDGQTLYEFTGALPDEKEGVF